MKTIEVTENDIREALGPTTGYSPLANQLIYDLFGHRFKRTPLEERVASLEKKIKTLSKRKKK